MTQSWRILIVEDDKKLLELYSHQMKALCSSDHTEVFSDPIQALYRYQERSDKFDLVVTDHNMPCFGSDLIKQVRSTNPQQRIIVITGVRNLRLDPQLKDIQVFQKPANIAEVINSLKKAAAA